MYFGEWSYYLQYGLQPMNWFLYTICAIENEDTRTLGGEKKSHQPGDYPCAVWLIKEEAITDRCSRIIEGGFAEINDTKVLVVNRGGFYSSWISWLSFRNFGQIRRQAA